MRSVLQASARQKDVLNETGINSVEKLMYADLRAADWSKEDAFYVTYREQCARYNRRELNRFISELEADQSVRDRIDGKKKSSEITPEALAKATSKNQILSDLLKARKHTQPASKEWSDLTKMIGDYARIKQDDLKETEEQIKYYIPVKYPRSCADCLIYKKNQEKKKK